MLRTARRRGGEDEDDESGGFGQEGDGREGEWAGLGGNVGDQDPEDGDTGSSKEVSPQET